MYLKRLWRSATLMTWAGLTAKSSEILIVLPMVVAYLTAEEVTVWLIILTLINLQFLADIGFTPTFTRAVANAFGGAITLDRLTEVREVRQDEHLGKHNYDLLGRVVGVMNAVYLRLSLFASLLLAIFGTLALVGPISALEAPGKAWSAWVIIVMTSLITFRGNAYVAYLQGSSAIPLLKRWQTITILLSATAVIVVIYLDQGLMEMVIANQAGQIIFVLGNRYLCKSDQRARGVENKAHIDHVILRNLWSASWRSGVGVFFGYALLQASGLIYAQHAPAQLASSYLIGLRFHQAIKQFSSAPFFTKIPELCKYLTQGNRQALLSLAKRGMTMSYWVYVAGFIGIGLFGSYIFTFLGRGIDFPPPFVWILLGLGGFVERFGAMHLQLYSTTNHIVWHIANGITGILFILFSILMFPVVDVVAFPLAMLMAYLGFYAWYSARHSYAAFGIDFVTFDLDHILFPLVFLGGYSIVAIWLSLA